MFNEELRTGNNELSLKLTGKVHAVQSSDLMNPRKLTQPVQCSSCQQSPASQQGVRYECWSSSVEVRSSAVRPNYWDDWWRDTAPRPPGLTWPQHQPAVSTFRKFKGNRRPSHSSNYPSLPLSTYLIFSLSFEWNIYLLPVFSFQFCSSYFEVLIRSQANSEIITTKHQFYIKIRNMCF